jgi:PhnB protein
MARVSTYLNFNGTTEAAFSHYRSVFGGNFTMLQRFSDGPAAPGQPPMTDADKNLILHIELPILGGHMLMGTDAPESMGFKLTQGNNIHLNLEPDTRAETQRLFDALAVNGKVEMPLAEMFWGGFFGHLVDQFGIGWMFNCTSKT